MDYIGDKCPVCDKYFHADDDVVVCPECGTPHHRTCYEELGHCANEALHSQGFDYSESKSKSEASNDDIICPRCGKANEKDCFFCKYCGASLTGDKTQTNTGEQQQNGGMPFGAGQGRTPFGMPFIDPLAGVPGDTDFGSGVTAGEAAKYVKQNTPYFIRVFSNIRNFNKSKFNFAAALFTGGYLLYRKMYKVGAAVLALQISVMILQLYLEFSFNSLFLSIETNASNFNEISRIISELSPAEYGVILLFFFSGVIRIALMITLGFTFNRLYMNHCIKQIVKIKNDTAQGDNPETVLQTKGGVNTALAVSLLITAMIMTYLPNIIAGFF